MTHTIPNNLSKSILHPLLGRDKDGHTAENYETKIYEFERKVESSLAETFAKLDIHATVKSDPYSLPYQKEITTVRYGESYINGPYEVYHFTRNVVKQLLNENIFKIRFYVWVDVDTEKGLLFGGTLTYHFRYYEH
jgi:hypothetical protein